MGSTRGSLRWRAAARHPTKLVPFVTVVEDDPQAAEVLRECIRRGARGLKLIGWAGRFIAEHDYDLCSDGMMAVYRVAAEAGIPVLVHVALAHDREEQTVATASRGAVARDYVADIDAILSAVPTLRLVLAHFGLGFDGTSLPRLHGLLEKHATLHIDTSLYGGARDKWLSRASNCATGLRALRESELDASSERRAWRGAGGGGARDMRF